jgi:hypothetical protein
MDVSGGSWRGATKTDDHQGLEVVKKLKLVNLKISTSACVVVDN